MCDLADGAIDLCLIDLEKTQWQPFRNRRILHDLSALNRRLPAWISGSTRLKFLHQYFDVKKLTSAQKDICRAIIKRCDKKHIKAS